MKSFEIESWALRVLERVKNKAPVEDSLVELKSRWPDPEKSARRIAAHANAALGEPILWLIGADETDGIIGADYQELSSWFQKVEQLFDGIAPALLHLNITFAGKSVAALCFDTSRIPFVARNPSFGKSAGEIELEVPWREGTRTRSARREEMILLMTPGAKVPKVEILGGEIQFVPMATDPASMQVRFNLKVYLTPLSEAPLTFPFHKCHAVLSHNGNTISDKFEILMDTPKGKATKASERRQMLIGPARAIETPHFNVITARDIIEATSDEAIFRGPGKIEIDGFYGVLTFDKQPELELTMTLIEAVTEAKVVLSCKFSKRQTNEKGLTWTLNRC